MSKRILVVEPHPDDGATRAGGTIAKMVREGNEACFLTITDGEKGSMDREITSPEILREIARKEALEACRILGVREDFFLGYPNHDVTPDLEKELRMRITEVIRKIKPQIVMTYDPYALYEPNPDHRTVAFATYDAATFSQHHLDFPEQIQKGLQPHLVDELWFFNSPSPDYTVDVTDFIQTKAKAMAAYATPMNSMLEEARQRLHAAGFSSSYLENKPLEEIVLKVFSPTTENGRFVEKFKIIRPFISERVPHLLSEGLIERLKD